MFVVIMVVLKENDWYVLLLLLLLLLLLVIVVAAAFQMIWKDMITSYLVQLSSQTFPSIASTIKNHIVVLNHLATSCFDNRQHSQVQSTYL